MAPPAASLRRYIIQAVGLGALCHIVSIFTIDSPKPIYHCPLDRHGLSHLWTDENCYWSTTYPEAREKFISLGNRLKEQLLLERDANGNNNQGGVLDVLDVQSMSYDIAHENFPAYVKSLKADYISSPQTVSPEKDTIDALLLTVRIPKNNTESVNIIHSSGTHGIEGYLGSAVQIRFLHELFLQNEKRLIRNNLPDADAQSSSSSRDDRVKKILVIHSVNPYGMHHHRRTNENNVDLNRNVLSEEMWRDIRKRDPNKFGYVEMDSTLKPFNPVDENGKLFSWVEAARKGGFEGDLTKLHQQDEKVKNTIYGGGNDDSNQHYASDLLKEPNNAINSWLDEKKGVLQAIRTVITALATMGYTNAKRGLVAAQYHKPSGLSYGGGAHNNNAWENSIFAVQHAINEFAGFQFQFSTRSVASSNNKALWIDVHTGLGKYGDYSVLTKGDSRCNNEEACTWITEFTTLLEGSQMGYGQSGDAGVSAGYDETYGFITDDILCPSPHCFAITQEFGTRPGVGVAVALIMENKGHNSVGGIRKYYGHLTSWAFNPQRLSWRRKALRGGMDMLHASLEF